MVSISDAERRKPIYKSGYQMPVDTLSLSRTVEATSTATVQCYSPTAWASAG